MAGFFMRRLASGAIEMFLLGFLLYALLVPPFISSSLNTHGYADFTPLSVQANIHQRNVNLVATMYAFDKPWPINYLTWLFHPGGTKAEAFPGGGYDPLQITSEDSGVLTEDVGYSAELAPGTHVLAALSLDGPGLPLLLSISFGALLFFMLVVMLQRRGRLVVYGLAVPDNPARMVWRRAELLPPS